MLGLTAICPYPVTMMMRLIILFAVFVIGFATGISYDRSQMQTECANGEGEWTGTICVNSELLQ